MSSEEHQSFREFNVGDFIKFKKSASSNIFGYGRISGVLPESDGGIKNYNFIYYDPLPSSPFSSPPINISTCILQEIDTDSNINMQLYFPRTSPTDSAYKQSIYNVEKIVNLEGIRPPEIGDRIRDGIITEYNRSLGIFATPNNSPDSSRANSRASSRASSRDSSPNRNSSYFTIGGKKYRKKTTRLNPKSKRRLNTKSKRRLNTKSKRRR